jgi:hypothetical protein
MVVCLTWLRHRGRLLCLGHRFHWLIVRVCCLPAFNRFCDGRRGERRRSGRNGGHWRIGQALWSVIACA